LATNLLVYFVIIESMKIYLARHGQTNYNEARLCNGDPNVEVYLTETGISQVNKLAEDLKESSFQHIFVSELLRTQQTADAVNQFHHLPITIDARLNDNRSGFEGKRVEDYYAAIDKSPNKWDVRFNGGESVADVKKRVNSFIEDLKKTKYDSVFIVTSMIIIQLIFGIIENLSCEELWKIKVERGSCAEVDL